MSISVLGSLFLLALGSGTLVWLPLVKPAEIRAGFFAFMLGGAAVLLMIGLALHPTWPEPVGVLGGVEVPPAVAFLGGPVLWGIAAALAPGAFQVSRITRPCLALVAVVGLVSAGFIPEAATRLQRLGFATSSLLLGASLVAMILGHWYLMVDGLDIRYLRNLNHALGLSVLLRAAVTGWALVRIHALHAGSPDRAVELAPGRMPEYLIWERVVTDPVQGLGMFFWMRVGVGFVAVGILYFMIRHTVKLKATQPATGLLYVVLCLVLVGEMTGFYLWGRTGWSL